VGAGGVNGRTAGKDASGKLFIAVLAFSAGGVIGSCVGVEGAGGNSSFSVGGGCITDSGHSSIVEQLVSPCPRIRGATPDWGAAPSLVGHAADSWVTPLFKELPTRAHSVSGGFLQDSHPNNLFSQRLIACVIIVKFALYVGATALQDTSATMLASSFLSHMRNYAAS